MIRNIILFVLLSAISLTAIADGGENAIIITSKDGSTVAYALSEKPNISFSSTDLIVTTGKIQIKYLLDNFSKITYDLPNSSVATISRPDESPFDISGNTLIFPGLKPGSSIAAYDISGKLILKQDIGEVCDYAVSIDSWGVGVYLVNVNGLTYKLMKK